ncbi:MAG: WD40/YVTN/BNR-like repeat-containing protein, partial [Armatimonadota bacterium]
MNALYVAMEDALLIIREGGGRWTVEQHLDGTELQCVAVDPQHSERIYVGTDDQGLWKSPDGGRTWAAAGKGITWADVTAVAVGQKQGGVGTVYAGTEPSAVFRSTDGGETWKELHGLSKLPSASTWSFPPRPET